MNRFVRNDDKKMFVIAEDYDQTPKDLERWDERMLDVDVARVMRMIIRPLPARDFAEDAPEMADNYFTEPYSKTAQDQFGYKDDVLKECVYRH